MPNDACEDFNEWYEFNYFCCVSDGCGAQLEAFKECKACPATPPPGASGIPPNEPTEIGTESGEPASDRKGGKAEERDERGDLLVKDATKKHEASGSD